MILRFGTTLLCLLFFAQMTLASQPAMSTLDTYEIDPVHTFVLFKVGHLGFSHSYGRFTDVKGTFALDEKKPENSKVDITIKVASLTTQNDKRDQHLKGPDFFNSKQFSDITFKSTAVKKSSGQKYKVSGNLTMKGVTKPVTFEFVRQRTGTDPMNNTKTGGDFTLTVKRSEFGINFMMGENMIPDEVTIIASVEAALKK